MGRYVAIYEMNEHGLWQGTVADLPQCTIECATVGECQDYITKKLPQVLKTIKQDRPDPTEYKLEHRVL
jgi:hypothetical protein